MKSLRIPLILLAFLALGSFSLNAAQLATAKVLSVTGTVTKYSDEVASSPLVAGDILREGDSIKTLALGGASLVFSNGSTVDLKGETNLQISEFTQTAFDGDDSYEQLQADPSQSQVLLELSYGELDGHVKSLRSDSMFDIETAVGTAAIRGTRFNTKLSFDPESGEFVLSVVNKDGKIDMVTSSTAGGGENGSSNDIVELVVVEALPAGQTFSVRLDSSDPKFTGMLQTLKISFPELTILEGVGETPEVIIITPEFDAEDPSIRIPSNNLPDR